MNGDYLDLERRFVWRKDYSPEELYVAEHLQNERQLSWPAVLEGRFSVVVAPANYGKSFELEQKAKELRGLGHSAVFLRLHEVLDEDRAGSALDSTNREALEDWQRDPTRKLVLFVDALDEAASSRERDLRRALALVQEWVRAETEAVTWVLSTRPAMLTQGVCSTISELLSAPFTLKSSALVADEPGNETAGDASPATTTSVQVPPDVVKVYSLLPLRVSAAIKFLSERCGVANPAELIAAAETHGLGDLADSPGSLKLLSYINLVQDPPRSLTEAYERVVNGAVKEQRRERGTLAGSPPADAMLDATCRLAAAAVVCQCVNLEIPQDALTETRGVLPAHRLAGPRLSDKTLDYLLGSALFVDTGHHQVKHFPDELLPFLAARHLAQRVNSPREAEALLAVLTWVAPTGEQGAFRHTIAMCGWLATLNEHCRNILIERDPAAVALFGDLRNSQVPADIAGLALSRLITGIADGSESFVRFPYTPKSEHYWQAGGPRTSRTLVRLFDELKDEPNARRLLIEMARRAGNRCLREPVLTSHGFDFDSLLHSPDDAWYVSEMHVEDDLAHVTSALLKANNPPEGLLTRLLLKLAWKQLNEAQIAKLIATRVSQHRMVFQLAFVVEHQLAPLASTERLLRLVAALLTASWETRPRESARPPGRQRLIEMIADLLAVAVVRSDSEEEVAAAAKLCWHLRSLVSRELYGSADVKELQEALQKNNRVAVQYTKILVARAKRSDNGLWEAVYFSKLYVPTAEDAVAAHTPLLVELQKTVDAQRLTKAPSRAKPKRVPVVGTPAKKDLRRRLPQIAAGTDIAAMAWIAAVLSQSTSKSRYGDISLDELRKDAGSEITDAVATGLCRFWRLHEPMFDEATPNSTFHQTIAGLQGLHLEMGEGRAIPPLSRNEVLRALAYGLFEINGTPDWFWPLALRYEAVSGPVLAEVALNANVGAVSLRRATHVLSELSKASPFIRGLVAQSVWPRLDDRTFIEPYAVRMALDALLQGELMSDALFRDAAEQHIKAVPQEPAALEWAAALLYRMPAVFTSVFIAWMNDDEQAASHFIERLAADLESSSKERLNALAATSDAGLVAISELYGLVKQVVRRADDIRRGDGVHSVTDRDRAQELRDHLLSILRKDASALGYRLLATELRGATEPVERTFILRLMHSTQERMHTRLLMTVNQYEQFERSFAPPLTGHQQFAQAVQNDISRIKHEMEYGQFSLRRFFSGPAYLGPPNKAAALALEDDFQLLLGRELEQVAGDRYTVGVEDQLAEGTRRDLLLQSSGTRVSVELKMSERWTVKDYVAALRGQLFGQYMQHRDAKIGFLVIVLQRERRWVLPDSKKRIDFKALIELLAAEALDVEANNAGVWLRVIGINACPRPSFRVKPSAPHA